MLGTQQNLHELNPPWSLLHPQGTSALVGGSCYGNTAISSCHACNMQGHAVMYVKLQGDLWQWYLEPSLYGTEVLTMGGSRGPSVSYYVPYLSAMQLLLPLDRNAASQPQSAAASHSAQTQQQQVPVDDSMQQSADAQSVSHAEKHQRLAVQEQAAGQQAGHHQQPARASGSPRLSKVYQVEADWQPWPRQVCFCA